MMMMAVLVIAAPGVATNVEGWSVFHIVGKGASKGVALDPLILKVL